MNDWLKSWGDFLNNSTRPFITNVVVFTLSYGFLTDKIDGATYAGLGGLIIGYWFRSRDEDKKDDSMADIRTELKKIKEDTTPQ